MHLFVIDIPAAIRICETIVKNCLGKRSTRIPKRAIVWHGLVLVLVMCEIKANTDYQKILMSLHDHRMWSKLPLCSHWPQHTQGVSGNIWLSLAGVVYQS